MFETLLDQLSALSEDIFAGLEDHHLLNACADRAEALQVDISLAVAAGHGSPEQTSSARAFAHNISVILLAHRESSGAVETILDDLSTDLSRVLSGKLSLLS